MLQLRNVGWQLHSPGLLHKDGLKTVGCHAINPTMEQLNKFLHVCKGPSEESLEEFPLIAVVLYEVIVIHEEPAAFQICTYLLNGSLHLFFVDCWISLVLQQGQIQLPQFCALWDVLQGINVGFCQIFCLQC